MSSDFLALDGAWFEALKPSTLEMIEKMVADITNSVAQGKPEVLIAMEIVADNMEAANGFDQVERAVGDSVIIAYCLLTLAATQRRLAMLELEIKANGN